MILKRECTLNNWFYKDLVVHCGLFLSPKWGEWGRQREIYIYDVSFILYHLYIKQNCCVPIPFPIHPVLIQVHHPQLLPWVLLLRWSGSISWTARDRKFQREAFALKCHWTAKDCCHLCTARNPSDPVRRNRHLNVQYWQLFSKYVGILLGHQILDIFSTWISHMS